VRQCQQLEFLDNGKVLRHEAGADGSKPRTTWTGRDRGGSTADLVFEREVDGRLCHWEATDQSLEFACDSGALVCKRIVEP
jgi:hypothetical protein